MLQALGAAVNKEKAMQAAMLEPIFTEYADMVLEIIGKCAFFITVSLESEV